MKTKLKIIIAALLIVMIYLSVFMPVIALSVSVNERALPAEEDKSAVEPSEKNMETALLSIKNLISIDTEEFPEFQYSYYDYNYINEGESVGSWSFSWYSADYSKSIYASVLDNGYVMSFNKYTSKYDNTKKLKNITRTQAEQYAGMFIKTFMPDSKYYKCTTYNTYLESDNLSLVYYAEINGYMFYDLYIKLNIDKFNGEITSMSRENRQVKDYNFVSPNNVISQANALAAYDKKLGLELVYNYYYDYSKKELKVYPVYQVKNSGKYINALTGETISVSSGQYADYGERISSAGMAKEEASMDMGFSPAEKAALESIKTAISKNKAVQIITELAEIDGETEGSTSLSQHYINKDQYLWNVYIYNDNISVSASVDAQTGKIINYNYYEYRNEKDKDAEKVSEDKLNASALEIIKKLSTPNLSDYADMTNYEIHKESSSYSLSFCKKVNGVPYLGSKISVSLDFVTGKLQRYSNNDYVCGEFPDVSAVKSTKEILGIINEAVPYGVKYASASYNEETKKYDTALIYDFKSTLSQIEPFTGKFLLYDGTINETEIGEPDYSDIKDDDLRQAVDALTDNGVELWNGKFLASKEMTEKEFYAIASSFFSSSLTKYYIYNDKEETYSDSPIKRKDACKIICEFLGYGDLAKNYKMFVNPFGNSIDLEYRGYIAVCNGLNMIRTDNPNNMYNANANVTRADLVYMLYGYIKNN